MVHCCSSILAFDATRLFPHASLAPRLKYSIVFGTFILLVSTFLLLHASYPRLSLHPDQHYTRHWSGWANVEKIFILQVTIQLIAEVLILTNVSGDSYSDTGFDYEGRQPCSDFPLGNPLYPLGTASDHVNWPVYLTIEYNQSVIETHNFARVGSTIDHALIPHGSSFVHQLREGFLRIHADEELAKWDASTTLFAIFFGMNDVLLGLEQYDKQEIPWLFDQEFITYASLIEKLYHLGARNFLFMNSPPIERTPYGYPAQGPAATYFNARLVEKATNFSATYPNTNVFQFDTHSFFNTVIDKPQSFPETALYKNTTKHCLKYVGDTKKKGFSDPSCGAPMRELLWRDSLHTTWPFHRAIASQIVKLLGG